MAQLFERMSDKKETKALLRLVLFIICVKIKAHNLAICQF